MQRVGGIEEVLRPFEEKSQFKVMLKRQDYLNFFSLLMKCVIAAFGFSALC